MDSTPRRIWSSSMDSNSAWKLPSPKPCVALALDDLEEDRADHRLREDLQQHLVRPPARRRSGCGSARAAPRPPVARQARRQHVVVRVRRVLERDAAARAAPRPSRRCRRCRARRAGCPRRDTSTRYSWIWLLSSELSLIGMRILPQGLVIALRLEPGQLAFDVEVADLAEVEQALVEVRPLVHAAAMHVVRQVVDVRQAGARRMLLDARQRHEVDVVDRTRRAAVRGAPR